MSITPDYTYNEGIRPRNQRVNRGDANISASINARAKKGNHSFFLCFCSSFDRCIAPANRDKTSISIRKQKNSNKLSEEVCSVFKMAACTFAILDFGAKMLIHCACVNHLVLMIIARVTNLVLMLALMLALFV